MSNFDLHKRYILNYPQEKVFEMWVSSIAVVSPVQSIEVVPEVGGIYKLTVSEQPKSQMVGTFLEFDRPTKVTYTWEWNDDGEVSEVHVSFNSTDEGTEVIIDHIEFTKEASRDTHDTGWDSYVAGLEQYLEKT